VNQAEREGKEKEGLGSRGEWGGKCQRTGDPGGAERDVVKTGAAGIELEPPPPVAFFTLPRHCGAH
jgi:hypothetical protein